MTSLAKSDNFPPKNLTSKEVIGSYIVTIKRRKIDDLFDQTVIKRSKNKRNVPETHGSIERKKFLVKKTKQKLKFMAEKISEVQTKINAITRGRPKIAIENYVDLDIPLMNFNYVNEYVLSDDVEISNENPVSCGCGSEDRKSCYNSRSSCCATQFESKFAYNREGKIVIPQGVAIYECCSMCSCNLNCGNRVVQQRNNRHKLCVFKTSNGRGWGLKTEKPISKGTFVEMVAGEIITSTEATRREKIQTGALKQSYLFDLDFLGEKKHQYSIDCFMYGNITRYVNHSCMPNLGVYNVWIEHRDHRLPKLALFALRDIDKDEELTIDYKPQVGHQSKKKSPRSGENPCLCGSVKCRQFIW